ncbi:hypothetical protein OS493_000883 [Desmophyllum pertusum]|uniref:C2 domain-containing protein n=1 Tax=Desmophyllum pertusum TaxID=174260 RepID=A0A9X0D4Z4_9CNID|nr:hypothetical protein OS493_000883 [Desmophyllum pertusum]
MAENEELRPQLSYMAELEATLKKRSMLGATGQHAKRQNKENQTLATAPKSSPGQASSSNADDGWRIPRVSVHRASSNAVDVSTFVKTQHNEPEPEAEPPAEKKGTMHALRKYSKSLLIPRVSSVKSPEKQSLFGEDPEKGVIGPGQLRRGSYQGHELGYIRLGLLAIRGTFELEIIRGISLLAPGDHPPDTYVKTYLIKDQVRLLKRKTSITRQSVNPVYNCKIRYPGCDLHNKELMVSIWYKQGIFGRKALLGEVRIALGSLNLSVKQVAWYKVIC